MVDRRTVALAVALLASGCTTTQSSDSTETTGSEVTAQAALSTLVADQPELEASRRGLPEGYELSEGGELERFGPDNANPVQTLVAVGASRSDPRFVEYTIFDYGDVESAEAALALVGPVEESDAVVFDSGTFGFVSSDGSSIKPIRSQLELLPNGPTPNAGFRGRVGDQLVLVGGSSSIQAADIEVMVDKLAAGEAPGVGILPERMSVLVNGTPPDGHFVELDSIHGTTLIAVYRDVDREWFHHASWGDPNVPLPVDLVDLAAEVSMQPPTNFGTNGAATDPVRVSFWGDQQLTIIEHPDTVPAADIATLASSVLEESVFGEWLAEAAESSSGQETEPASADPDRGSSEPPSPEDLAAFQQFVEESLGVELGQPIVFDFVPDFPTEGIEFDFISRDLWLVAAALGLTGDGNTFDEANQSRIDAIRGTPGVIALQPTKTETDVVAVHEMVHVLDAPPANAPSAELFSMEQAVAEGNAHRVAYDYLQTLGVDEQAIMEPFPHIFPDGGDPRISRAVQDLLEFAYDEGRLFMAAAAEDGGQDRVNEVFQRPPISTEQLLFFDAWLTDDRPVSVTEPPVPDSATVIGEGSLGVYLLLLVANQAGSPVEGRDLLTEWSGDSYVLYETGSELCLSASLLFDSAGAAAGVVGLLESAAEAIAVDGEVISATFCG